LQGNDSINVIDRVVSTRIVDSPDSHGVDVLFCDYNGRITDIGSIYKIQEKILLLSSEVMGDKTRKTLIDGKSWNEHCDLIIADEAIGRVTLVSDDFQSIFTRMGFDGIELERNRVIEIDDMIAVKSEFPGGSVLDILLPLNQMDDFMSILETAEYSEMSDDRWNFVRLGVCIPTLTDISGNLPNECGMINLISNDKGCYPGQEVHARLESRGRTVKRLCLLTGEAAISPGKYRLSNGSPAHITSCESSDSVSYGIAKLRVNDIESGYVNLDGAIWKVESLTYL
tara:strand:+ start:7792 stop:8643 length:852 start_codon:yes stop_codon:yes gene_type:complete